MSAPSRNLKFTKEHLKPGIDWARIQDEVDRIDIPGGYLHRDLIWILEELAALQMGYEEEAPEGFELVEGMSYNHYFRGNQIAMPEPLYDEAVEYADGTEPSLEQLAHDLSVFLAWTAEPELEIRKKTGLKVLIFIAIFTALVYIIKRRIWAKLH